MYRMTVLGKGAFGCVVSPSLKCTDSSIKTNKKVSKIMRENDAMEEMTEYKVLEKIPELKKYLLTFPQPCKPVNDEKFHNAIKQCKHARVNRVYNGTDTNSISSLLLENGGVGLGDLVSKFTKKLSMHEFEIFLTSIKNLFETLIILRKHKYVHQDIKANNIVYSLQTGKISLIDFGKLSSFQKIKQNSQNDSHNEGTTWFNYPPEAKFMNKSKNPFTKDTDYLRFLEETMLSWDSYSLAFCLNELFSELNHKVRIERLLKDFPNYENTSKKKREQLAKFFVYGRSLLRPFISHADTNNLSDAELKNYIVSKIPLRDNNLLGLKGSYINLLKECGLYRTTLPKPSKEVIEIEQENSIQHMVEESSNQHAVNKKCKDGKEPHPITNRCVKKCNKGETRDRSGKCKKSNNGKTVKAIPLKKASPNKSAKTNVSKKSAQTNVSKISAQKTNSNKTEKAINKSTMYKVYAYIDANEYECKRK